MATKLNGHDMPRSLDGAPLSVLQRVLLATNGTVTDFLEAYADEAMLVVKRSQSLGTPMPHTKLGDDDQLALDRTITLQGARSGTTFLHADSYIAADRLPPGMLDALMETGKPLGRLLSEHRVESFREIVAAGLMTAGPVGEYFGVEASSRLLFRTYLIHVGGRPLMRIREKFPTTWFSEQLER
ncbi:MAG: chorismate--pyruvate lyase family protein [Acidimicrobiales bacterium]